MPAPLFRLVPLACLAVLCACSEQPHDYFSGYAEADYLRLASPVGGSLTKLFVQRGDRVAPGASLFVLEADSERAARQQAQAALERAQAILADLRKGRRPEEVSVIEQQLAQANAALTLSRAALAREMRLQAAQFVSPARLDEAKSAFERDQAHAAELLAQLRVARLGARSDALAAATQDVLAAQAALAQADWKLAQKSVKAPAAAQVADVLFREGELVAPGQPVVSLLAPELVRARFFVPQAQLGALALGQQVSISCDGCAKPVAATISFIAHDAQYTAPLIYSKDNRATLVFMVEARPAPAAAAMLHPGQPVEVRLAAPAAGKGTP
jgi:HlyD family secretion protein